MHIVQGSCYWDFQQYVTTKARSDTTVFCLMFTLKNLELYMPWLNCQKICSKKKDGKKFEVLDS